MALKARVADLESVPEEDRKHYEKNGDGFVANIEPVEEGDSRWALEDVGGLKRTLSKVQAKEKKARGWLKDYGEVAESEEGLTFEPKAADDSTSALQAEIDRLKAIKPGDKVAELHAAELKRLREEHKAATDKQKGDNSYLQEQLERSLIRGQATAALADKGVVDKGWLEFLVDKVQARAKIEKDDAGNLSARLLGEGGEVLLTKESGSTDPMSFDEYVTTSVVDKYPGGFKGSGASGGGRTGDGGSGGGGGRPLSEIKDPVERLKAHYERQAAEQK
jgi:hypothetical protein